LGTRIAVLALAAAGLASAAELGPETRAAFDRYVRQAESRIEAQVRTKRFAPVRRKLHSAISSTINA
jgi:hypothetical protein